MNALLGVIFHCLGGFASGSFYLPYKKVKGWAWETYWLAGGIFSWLIVPLLAAWLTVPGFIDIIKSASSSTLFYTYLMGLLWGIGGLTFGLSMRYLGMSLGMSVALGFCSAFGALVPSIYYNFNPEVGKSSFTDMLQSNSGLVVLLSVVVCLIGIAICGKAGMRKEKELTTEQKTAGVKEFNLSKGLMVATISGILSACFSFGIEAGKPMAYQAEKPAIEIILQHLKETGKPFTIEEEAKSFQGGLNAVKEIVEKNKNYADDNTLKEKLNEAGRKTLFVNNVIFVVILLGGLTINFIWCIFLHFKNKTFGDYTNKKFPLKNNLLFCAIAGTTWFLQFFFYGMGETKLGNGASSWILHMATIIITSNLWGIRFNEWKGVSKKTYTQLLAGVGVILLSVILGGIAKLL
jgi:L-rhamnose-H+ transport protein